MKNLPRYWSQSNTNTEVYSLVFKEFTRKHLKIWLDAEAGSAGIHHDPDDIANDGRQYVTNLNHSRPANSL